MNNRYTRASSILLVLVVGIGAFAGCGRPPQPTPGKPTPITILHTNDIHGKFTEQPATWRDGSPPIGGFGNLSAYVAAERAVGGRLLLLDVGDFMTGNPICDYDHDGVKGGAMVAFMNLVGYDAAALGNHEFDHGVRNLERLVELAKFPFLSANLYRPGGGLVAPARYHIFELEGLRVGVIGVMTEGLYEVTAPSMLAGVVVTPAAEAVREVVREIDSKTDLIILLSHRGYDRDVELAHELEHVDLILGAHSHSRLRSPEEVNGIWVAQAGHSLTQLGRVNLVVQGDRIISCAGELIDLWPREGQMPQVAALEAEYAERIQRDFGRVIGRLATAWERSGNEESNIGDWLADRLREFGGGDFAVINSGGIRKDLPPGPITRMDVLEILPFSNVVTTFKCSGAQLLGLVEQNARAMAGGRGMLQVSGLRYAFSARDGEITILEATVGGRPIDPNATYTGVSIDYVSHGNAESYFGFDPAEKSIREDLLSDVIERAIEGSDTIESRVDGRILMVSGQAAAGAEY